MRADSVKEYIERNTDEKLGFVPEHLKGASKKQIMLYQRKSRKREKKLNREHFELYKGRIKKECRSRLQTQIAKKAEEDYRERELVKKEGDYFKRLGALNEKNKDRPKDEESAVIEKMIKRRMKSRIC